MHDFYSQYEIVKVTARNADKTLRFVNGQFHHPSYCQKTKHFLQSVAKREKECLVKVFQYDFPDTAEFGGSILDEERAITDTTEIYAKLALLLFCPF